MRLPPKKITLFVVVFCAICAGASIFWVYRGESRQFSGTVDRLTLGICRDPISILILIAEDQGFFAQNGLAVATKDYDSGAAAATDLIAGKIDIAATSDFVAARHVLNGHDMKVLGAVDRCRILRLIARIDSGVRKFSDIKGKRIGLPLGTVAEFFLHRALAFSRLSPEDIEIVNLEPLQTVEAIKEARIDACVIWSPLDDRIAKALGPNAVSWPVQRGQDYYWLLLCNDHFLARHSSVIKRLMRALVSSERFISSDEEEAKHILAKLTGERISFIDNIWTNHRPKLTLDQQLILAMEDQARWLIAKGWAQDKVIPNFLNFLHPEGLESVKPEGVSVSH